MNREQILEFLNAHPACHLATIENNQPRVRGMLMYRADESGILFHTGTSKSLAKQVTNKAVEICFNSPDTQIRVAGMAEIVDDLNLKKEVVEARPFMKPWVEQKGYGILLTFRVTHCQATVWTMATNFNPTCYQSI